MHSVSRKGIWNYTVALMMALVFASAALTAGGQTPTVKTKPGNKGQAEQNRNQADVKDWWKNAVIYEIYPRSFKTRTATESAI